MSVTSERSVSETIVAELMVTDIYLTVPHHSLQMFNISPIVTNVLAS